MISAFEILRISGKILETGDDEEALEWLTFGVSQYPHDPRMHSRAAEIHLRAGRQEKAAEHLWDNFATHPSLETYGVLASSGAPKWRRQAQAFLRKLPRRRSRFDERHSHEVGHSVLVEVLLADDADDADAAWRAAKQGGCRDELWLELARRRGKAHPAESIEVFLDAAEHAISLKTRDTYARAAAFLAETRPLYRRLAQTSELRAYLAELRETYRTRRALLDELDRAGLP